MRKEPQLSEWIDGSVKPTLPGVYQRMWPHHEAVNYFRFDGSFWFAAAESVFLASVESDASMHQYLPWRGLAHDPALSEGHAW
jgi:hypothetical protein